jgi:intraflagellar transport protein 172
LWARSLGGESAVKLLTKFGLLDAALDFASENGAFDFAFELSRFADKYKIEEIHYKHAMYLEDEGKFKQAQDAFILAGKPREAILMHIHNQDWDLALQVAEAYDSVSVIDVLIGQAKVAFTQGDYSKSESLLLRAQKPEIAIKFYKEINNWTEAIRFAKQHVPNKAMEVQADYDEYLSSQSDSGKDHIVASAVAFEKQYEFARAVEMYLKLSKSHTTNIDFLQEKWEYAIGLALKHLPEKATNAASLASRQLITVNRHAAAGAMLCGVELYKDAIDVFIAAGLWDNARKVLTVAPKLKDYIEAAYVNNLKSSANADALMGLDSNAAIESYAKRGEWDKCLEMASLEQNQENLPKYLGRYFAHLSKDLKYDTAVKAAVKYGSPANTLLFDYYLTFSQKILASEMSFDLISPLRDLLFNIVLPFKSRCMVERSNRMPSCTRFSVCF